MIYDSQTKLLEDVDWLVNNIMENELSAYLPQYKALNITTRVIEDEIGNGFLVWFYTGKEVKQTFTVSKNKETDLDVFVHEALCRILDIHA